MKGIAPLQGEIIAKEQTCTELKKNLFQNQQAKFNQTLIVQIILG
jgi:hypothetical protein